VHRLPERASTVCVHRLQGVKFWVADSVRTRGLQEKTKLRDKQVEGCETLYAEQNELTSMIVMVLQYRSFEYQPLEAHKRLVYT
jgi:hypothetical protein